MGKATYGNSEVGWAKLLGKAGLGRKSAILFSSFGAIMDFDGLRGARLPNFHNGRGWGWMKLSTSFCSNALRSPGGRKVVQSFSSRRQSLAGYLASGRAGPSRTKVHDYFRRRASRPGTRHGAGLSTSFGANTLRSPGRKKVVQSFSSRRQSLAGYPASGGAGPSRTKVHDYFRRRPSMPGTRHGAGLSTSFGANTLRSPGGKKVVQSFSSRRRGLESKPARGRTTPSRTKVHDYFRRRPLESEVLRSHDLFRSSFRQQRVSRPAQGPCAWPFSPLGPQLPLAKRRLPPIIPTLPVPEIAPLTGLMGHANESHEQRRDLRLS